jgi:CRP-like cAMP-binding protein
MTVTSQSLQRILSGVAPFDQLPGTAIANLAQSGQLLRYRIGQPIVRPEALPQLVLITEGQARLLGEDPRTDKPVTLQLLDKGSLLGIVGLLRGQPCETAIASSEVVGCQFSMAIFQQTLDQYPDFATAVRDQLYLAEVFDLLARQVNDQAEDAGDLAKLSKQAQQAGRVHYLPYGKRPLHLPSQDNYTWFVSSGTIINQPMGSQLNLEWAGNELDVISPQGARLVGLPDIPALSPSLPSSDVPHEAGNTATAEPTAIPYAPEHLPEPEPESVRCCRRLSLCARPRRN